MKKIPAFIFAILFANLLQAQSVDYDNLAKEYQDIAIQALATIKPSTKKWVEETVLKHPAGKFDTSWVKNQVAGLVGGGIPEEGLWALMLAYQKMLNKESKAEHKTSRADAAFESKNKENKMAGDNNKIDQQRQEANERYDQGMQAANTQSKTGIASSSTQSSKQDTIKKLLEQLAELKRSAKF